MRQVVRPCASPPPPSSPDPQLVFRLCSLPLRHPQAQYFFFFGWRCGSRRERGSELMPTVVIKWWKRGADRRRREERGRGLRKRWEGGSRWVEKWRGGGKWGDYKSLCSQELENIPPERYFQDFAYLSFTVSTLTQNELLRNQWQVKSRSSSRLLNKPTFAVTANFPLLGHVQDACWKGFVFWYNAPVVIQRACSLCMLFCEERLVCSLGLWLRAVPGPFQWLFPMRWAHSACRE